MAAITKSRKDKTARITTACNACRSRKQKCSGKRPNCEQCIANSRPCEWPEQLKRGPTKGYVEALEQRLLETEDVLLKIVAQLTHAQLNSMLKEQASFSIENVVQDQRAAPIPMSQSRKRGVEHWKSFPLNDVHGIRKWQEECYRTQSDIESLHHKRIVESPKQTRSNLPKSPSNGDSVTEEGKISMRPLREKLSTATSERNDHMTAYAGPSIIDVEFQDGSLQQRNPVSSRDSHKQKPCEVNQTISSWEGAPSKRFQQQFLW